MDWTPHEIRLERRASGGDDCVQGLTTLGIAVVAGVSGVLVLLVGLAIYLMRRKAAMRAEDSNSTTQGLLAFAQLGGGSRKKKERPDPPAASSSYHDEAPPAPYAPEMGSYGYGPEAYRAQSSFSTKPPVSSWHHSEAAYASSRRAPSFRSAM